MAHQSFYIRAIWDDEAKVFISESDISGLHIEAEKLEEFEKVLDDIALELIIANHIEPEVIANRPPKDWVPTIKFDPGCAERQRVGA